MKVIFHSKDPDVALWLDNQGKQDWVLAEDEDSLFQVADAGNCLVFLDYDLGKSEMDGVVKKLKKKKVTGIFLLSSKMSVRDIKKHQTGSQPLEGYIIKPLEDDLIDDMISDFQELNGISNSDNTGSSKRKIDDGPKEDLTFVGQSKTTVQKLKEGTAEFESDFDDSFDEEVSSIEEIPEEDDDAPFVASEMKVDTAVKKMMKEHGNDSSASLNLNDPVNIEIQNKFDGIFGEIDYSNLGPESSNMFDDGNLAELMSKAAEEVVPIRVDGLDLGEESEVTSTQSGADVLAFNKKESNTQNKNKIESKEVAMSENDKKNDDSLMFDLDLEGEQEIEEADDSSSKSKVPEATMSDSMAIDESIVFSLDEGDQGGSDKKEVGLDEAKEQEEATTVFSGDKGLDLGGDDGFELETAGDSGGEGTQTQTQTDSEMGLDLGGDDDGFELETSSGSAKSSSGTQTHTDEMSLDEDGPEEFDYKTAITNADNLKKANASDDEFDMDMDLSAQEEADDEDEGATKVLSSNDLESALNDTDDVDFAVGDSDIEALDASNDSDLVNESVGVDDEDLFDVGSDNLDSVEVSATKRGSVVKEDNRPIIVGLDRVPTAVLKEDELVKLHATIGNLKQERETLLKELSKLKDEKRDLVHENTGLRADLDEVRIELSIIKKRNDRETEDLKYQLGISEEKKSILEQKCRTLTRELEKVGEKVRVDVNKIKQREKELENKLELQVIDSESQVKSRDQKILDLKRKIDALEFNMENASIKEQKSRDDKRVLEDKLKQVIQLLRNSIQMIGDDVELPSSLLQSINDEDLNE